MQFPDGICIVLENKAIKSIFVKNMCIVLRCVQRKEERTQSQEWNLLRVGCISSNTWAKKRYLPSNLQEVNVSF